MVRGLTGLLNLVSVLVQFVSFDGGFRAPLNRIYCLGLEIYVERPLLVPTIAVAFPEVRCHFVMPGLRVFGCWGGKKKENGNSHRSISRYGDGMKWTLYP